MSFVQLSVVLGNLGEFIGSIAVLATLIYLAVEVRHSRELLEENRKMALSQVAQMRANSGREMFLLLGDSDYLAPLYAKRQGIDEDTVRLRAMSQVAIIHAGSMLTQYRLGLLDDEAVAGFTESIIRSWQDWEQSGVYVPPSVRKWYEEHRARE